MPNFFLLPATMSLIILPGQNYQLGEKMEVLAVSSAIMFGLELLIYSLIQLLHI